MTLVSVIHIATDAALIVLPVAVYCKMAILIGRFARFNDADPVEEAKAKFNAAVDRGDTRAINRTWKEFNAARHAQLADEVWRPR